MSSYFYDMLGCVISRHATLHVTFRVCVNWWQIGSWWHSTAH